MSANQPAGKNITPETKVADVLKNYPELEDVLIDMSPSFKKLRNPILRRTVGRVATLRHVAQVGGISVGQLVNTLRRQAGLSELTDGLASGGEAGSAPPEWFDPTKIVSSLDARPMIEAGRQPMGTVLSQLRQLPDGKIHELITPFVPAPLIDAARQQGYRCWTSHISPEEYRTYFTKS